MKANELMIGDWVMLTDPIHNGEKVQVKAIPDDGHITVDGGIMPMFEPIPLTAEILEKNGFRKDLMYFYLNIDFDTFLEFYTHEKILRLWFDGVDEWVKATTKDLLFQCQCRYIHELQHALRLCGIEKEIEL